MKGYRTALTLGGLFCLISLISVTAAGTLGPLLDQNTIVIGNKAGQGPDPDSSNKTYSDYDKIYNGTISKYRYPFFVAIMRNQGYGWEVACGGSLIDPTHVLSAGHCTIELNSKSKWQAWLNPYDNNKGPMQIINIIGSSTFRGYTPKMAYHDIGIYKLELPAVLNKDVSTICLLNVDSYDNIPVTLVGFGKTGCKQSTGSDIMLYAGGRTISSDKCSTTRGNPSRKAEVCAIFNIPHYAEQNNGDSGGPLFTNRNGVIAQVGLVSWNYKDDNKCPMLRRPGSYTIPAKYLVFIRQHSPNVALC